jgi:hypothetical protein
MKTNSRGGRATLLPSADPLADAFEQAEQVLTERDRVFAQLARTSVSIPDLLRRRQDCRTDTTPGAETRTAEVERQLSSQVRLRISSTEELVGKHDSLEAVAKEVEAERQVYADQAVEDFLTRYNAAAAHLAQLQAEGRQLSIALRIDIDLALPGTIESPAPAVTIDPLATRFGVTLDRLASALAFRPAVAGLAHRAASLDRSGSTPAGFDSSATFTVLRAFTDHLTGASMEPGMLVNADLLPAPMLARLFRSRYLAYANRSACAA